MADEDLSYKVSADIAKAEKDLDRFIGKLGDLSTSAVPADKALDNVEKSGVRVASSVRKATTALQAHAKELKSITAGAKAMQAYAKATEDAAKAQARFKSNTNLKNFSVFGKAQDPAIAAQVPKSFGAYSGYKPDAMTQELHRQRDATFKQAQENNNLAASNARVQKSFEGIANTRYALYDVARSLTVVSAATLGLATAAIKTEADYESLFTSVQRVAQTDDAGFAKLKEDLIDLSTVIPGTIQDITAIATLGGQLGIASENIDEFTETVIKFSATTNVSAEAAAEKIGRIAQLAGVSAGEYSNLGSAIYQAGITSVSTEAQILSVTEQIAVSARQAGFAAEETIALSSALASLGVAPERARGSIQRVFNIITNAVDNGSKELAIFAQRSGMTAEEFGKMWKDDAQGAFLAFLEGLGRAGDAGENLNNILADVGIKAVRDSDALRRLAQNTEVYAKAIDESTTAYAENTALADGYALVTDDLNAKLTMLGNTLKAIIEAAQDNTPLKALVDALQAVLDVMLDLGRTNTGKVVMGVVTAFGILLGLLAAAGATTAMFAASLLAAITALRFMTKGAGEQIGVFKLAKIAITEYLVSVKAITPAQAQAATASRGLSGALTGVAASSRAASVAIRGIKYALISTGVGIALVALGETISWLWQKFDGSDEVQRFTDDLQGLSQALSGDTKAVLDGTAESVTSFVVAVDDSGNVLSEGEVAAMKYADGVDNMSGRVLAANEAIKTQIVHVGELTKEWLANNLVAGEGGEEFLKNLKTLEPYLKQAGYDIREVFDAAIQGQPVDLSALRTRLVEELKKLEADVRLASPSMALDNFDADKFVELTDKVTVAKDALKSFDEAVPALESVNGRIIESIQYGEGLKLVYEGLGIALDDAGEEGADLEDVLQGIIDTSLGAANATVELRNSLYGLGQTLADNGVTLDLNTDAGRRNYTAISQTVALLKTQAGGNEDIFRASLQNLLNMLEKLGFTNQQLAVFRALLGNTTADVGQVAVAGEMAGDALQDGFDRGAVAANNTGKAAKNVAKEVVTLTDYVRSLSSVMSAAFNFRFGFQQAKDDVTSATRAISDAFEKAQEKVKSLKLEIMALKASIQTLKATQNTLEYFLSIAIEYGDTLRETEIRALLAENAAKQAEAQEDLSDTQKELTAAEKAATPTLKGNTDAAIDQREAVLALVEARQAEIEAFIATGASAKQVAAFIKQSKKEFEDQLKAMGYSREEIKKYSVAFDDMLKIFKEVPNNVTVKVDADTSPADKALKEFFAKNKDKKVKVSTTNTVKTVTTYDGKGDKAKRKSALLDQISILQTALSKIWAKNGGNSSNATLALEKRIKNIRATIASGSYKTGGFTGNGNPNDEAGVVHKEEFVMDAQATAFYGPSQLQAMMTAARAGKQYVPTPTASGSSSGAAYMTGPMDLSAATVQALALAVQPYLVLDGKIAGRAVANANASETRTGAY